MSVSRFTCIVCVILCSLSFIRVPEPASTCTPASLTKDSVEDLTISYTIELTKSRNRSIGIGEAYNGGTKTIFISNGLARLRLVSLMRMQSIFILPPGNPQRAAAIVKESGKNKHKVYLTDAQWKQYNAKYNQVTCHLDTTGATITISGYRCSKAMITLTDGRSITVFYTKDIQRTELVSVEPVFSCIPGLVLKYIYEYKKGKITYTATAISRKPIDQDILRVPSKGYTLQQYQPGTSDKEN
jgi:hypothetical protein